MNGRTMKFTLERVSDPEIEPVTLAEMKLHLRGFAATTEDARITGLIKGGREWLDGYTGRICIDQTWRLTLSDYVSPFANVDSDTVRGVYTGACVASSDGIPLRRSPVLALISFKTVDSAGVETAVTPTSYEVREADSKWPRLVGLNGESWSSGTMRIVFRAGFADMTGSPQDGLEVVPECFKQAIKLHAEAMYDRDKDMMQKLLEVAKLLVESERTDLGFA